MGYAFCKAAFLSKAALHKFVVVVLFSIALSASFAERAKNPAPPFSFNCSSQPEGAFDRLSISNKAGTVRASFIPYGATATNLHVRDKDGVMRDILLGFDNTTYYCAAQHTYFGATIGRIANRIAGGNFTFHNKTYYTDLNEDVDTLHGGWMGFDRRVWLIYF